MSLNLNYKPNVFVNTENLPEDEWLEWRRKGIGGSDVAAALGLSPYRTMRELYYDKIGVVPVEAGEDKSITFQIGHLLEDVVAQIFAKKTGLSVFRDQTMYQHPLYPFMLADVDRFVHMPDGTTAILECKTAHYDTQYLWANDAVPRHYEMQVRHYMSVMNIDVAYIACLFSNSEKDFVWRKIERDLDEEENTIMLLQDFWTRYVCNRVEPPLNEKPDIRGSGIMLPDRNSNGEIEAIQIRLDKVYKSKFNNLTSVDQYYGTSAACCPHFVGVEDGVETVYLTEGVMKADIAYHLSMELGYPRPFVGLTGVGNINQYLRALEELERLGIKKIMVAFDMDATVNDNVRKAKDRVIETGCDAGFDMTPMTWDPRYKGIDDLLYAVKKKRLMNVEE